MRLTFNTCDVPCCRGERGEVITRWRWKMKKPLYLWQKWWIGCRKSDDCFLGMRERRDKIWHVVCRLLLAERGDKSFYLDIFACIAEEVLDQRTYCYSSANNFLELECKRGMKYLLPFGSPLNLLFLATWLNCFNNPWAGMEEEGREREEDQIIFETHFF